ncbi:unnamed protein product [Gadus morhua 'NCC']
MGKKFYFVRSKIDNNLSDAKRGQREYDEERTLQEIRKNCIQELEQGVKSPQVFLVSSFDLHLYDFPALQETMERELPSHKRDVLNRGIPKVCKSIINKKKETYPINFRSIDQALTIDQQGNTMGSRMSSTTAVSSTSTEGPDLPIAEGSNMMENNDTDSAVSMIKKYLEDINNPLNIAVTGRSGVGKSTFVNAFRGIENKDERAAPTGVVETTMKPEPYPHPRHPNVTLWDLPGVGTPEFPADQYLKVVEFEKFDLFIIVSADRFTEHDAKLAQEIKTMGKNLYFVRSKIDHNLEAARKSQREYDEEKTLQEIRENCIQGLEKQGVASPQVFLVSSFDLDLYDFPALQDTMERELPSHKRDVLNRGIPKVCKSIINKKKEVFRTPEQANLKKGKKVESKIPPRLQISNSASSSPKICSIAILTRDKHGMNRTNRDIVYTGSLHVVAAVVFSPMRGALQQDPDLTEDIA